MKWFFLAAICVGPLYLASVLIPALLLTPVARPPTGLRAFRCGERMEAVITAQAGHTPLTASERACWAEWQGEKK